MEKFVYTIGHSTRELNDFLELLNINSIKTLVDVRAFPGSRRYPQYNKDELSTRLEKIGITYIHMPELGGRRKASPKSENTAWKNEAFKAYADYMNTPEFKHAIDKLAMQAADRTTAYMCSEAVWWRCHRRLISDWFVANGWNVLHIMSKTKNDMHKLQEEAVVLNGRILYPGR
ncbi:MAG: DUF488 family protein [Cytophagaceae bacterium]